MDYVNKEDDEISGNLLTFAYQNAAEEILSVLNKLIRQGRNGIEISILKRIDLIYDKPILKFLHKAVQSKFLNNNDLHSLLEFLFKRMI